MSHPRAATCRPIRLPARPRAICLAVHLALAGTAIAVLSPGIARAAETTSIARQSYAIAAGPVNDLHLSANQYGNAKLHADLSRRSEDGRFGVRVNAAVEDERSYIHQMDGERKFFALAADWHLAPDTLLQVDVEHERRNQHGQPFPDQDVNGRLPSGFDPRTFLGPARAENLRCSGREGLPPILSIEAH